MNRRRCRVLRKAGFSIGQIAQRLQLSESTVHGHVKDIQLTTAQREWLRRQKQKVMQAVNAKRRGRPIHPIIFKKPVWSKKLVHLVAHLSFDGRIDRYACHYYSRSQSEALHIKRALQQVLNVMPTLRLRSNSIWVVSYYNVAVAAWLAQKERELLPAIHQQRTWQREWLKALFDDEGHVYVSAYIRRVRASQDDSNVLDHARRFLKTIGIESRIDECARAVEITGQHNLRLFQRKINFSPGLTINAQRKNGLWNEPFEKRILLQRALNSYTAL